MKIGLLKYISCPDCAGSLRLLNVGKERDEIVTGELRCWCGRKFLVVRGVPRLLLSEKLSRLEKQTAKSFGYEWNVFNSLYDSYRMNFLNYIDPIKEGFFKDKIVLDAGCGAGRHTYWSAKFGSREVIGVDISDAVDAAYQNTRGLSNVHIVQADIHNLPLKREVFDYIFSIGVLHHLPNPERGFYNLSRYLKQSGTFSIWVYGRKNNFANVYLYETARVITRRLPSPLLHVLCYLPAAVAESINFFYRNFKKTAFTKSIANILPFQYYAQFPFRVKVNDAFDAFATPKSSYWLKDQIEGWYERAGFINYRVSYLRRKSLKAHGSK